VSQRDKITLQSHHILRIRVTIVNHCIFKRFEEILLEFEVRELLFLQETRSELPKRVECKEADFAVRVASHLKKRIVEDPFAPLTNSK
jgi:hypothetical protein